MWICGKSFILFFVFFLEQKRHLVCVGYIDKIEGKMIDLFYGSLWLSMTLMLTGRSVFASTNSSSKERTVLKCLLCKV